MPPPIVSSPPIGLTGKSKRILWVRVGGCFPLNSGGRIRSYFTLTHLLPSSHLHVVELHREGEPPQPERVAYAHDMERVFFKGLPAWSLRRLPAFLWPLLRNFFFSREPFALERYRCEKLSLRVQSLVQGGGYDLVVCDGLAAASAFENWDSKSPIPTIMFQHNVEALIWERLASVQHHSLKRFFFHVLANRMHQREAELCRLFDGVITISEEDASYHRETYSLANVLGCVPAGATTDARGVPEPVLRHSETSMIAFLGSMDWLPNQDAVIWFIKEIFPRLRQTLPDARLLVIGRSPPPHLLKLAGKDSGVQFTGTVEEVSGPLRQCALMIVPLRAGSGTRIKILEAMAMGVPVVSTSVGAEGLPLHSNHDLLIADDVPGITNSILRLLGDDELRKAMAENGLRRVTHDFSWSQSAQRFLDLTSSLQTYQA